MDALVKERKAAPSSQDVSSAVSKLTGHIKWFDPNKGYGFIVPDNGMPDVLLHVTCLRRDGYHSVLEGARVVVETLEGPKGLLCFRILSMDESTAAQPSIRPPKRRQVSVVPSFGPEKAWAKWFNRLRGFGFLTRGQGTPDIFIHMETLRRCNFTELRPGQNVWVRYGQGPQGFIAADVRPAT